MNPDIIILIDDNPTTLFYNEDVINEKYPGVKVVTYENSEEALNDFLNSKYESFEKVFLFLDINMPNYTGFEFLSELEDELDDIENLNIIMLTSSKMKSDTEKASRFSQVIGYIEKPITLKKINEVFE